MLADPTTCTAGLKAAVSLGFTKPLYGVASCGTTDFSKNAATYAGGVTLTQGNVSPTGDDADAKIFTQAMDKCGKKTEDLFHAIDGFQRHKRLHRPAEVGHEDPGLAGDVRAEEPGVRVHQEGVRGDLVTWSSRKAETASRSISSPLCVRSDSWIRASRPPTRHDSPCQRIRTRRPAPAAWTSPSLPEPGRLAGSRQRVRPAAREDPDRLPDPGASSGPRRAVRRPGLDRRGTSSEL